MVAADGQIVYSTAKTAVFASNIKDSQLVNSPLAIAVKGAAGTSMGARPVFSGFKPFSLNNDEISAFLAIPIWNDWEEFIGTLVLELSIEPFKMPLRQENVLGEHLVAVVVDRNLDVRLHNEMSLMHSETEVGNDHSDHAIQTITFDRKLARGLIDFDEHTDDHDGHGAGEEIKTYAGNKQVFETQSTFELFGKKYVTVWQIPYDEVTLSTTNLLKRNSWMVLICSVLFLAAMLYVVRTIVSPLKTLENGLNEIAQNRDLSKRVSSGTTDEIGKSTSAVDHLLQIVEAFVREAKTSADDLVSLSVGMKSSAEKLSRESEIQASSVEELSASLEETDAQAESTSHSASDAAEVVREANAAAKEGNTRVNEMVGAISAISASSKDIAKIIKVINEIAFQTNILALNASVEAARAGAKGRGFSVVAAEVGNLANRSAKAAQETEALIVSTLGRIELGEKVSKKTSDSFGEIVKQVARASELVEIISQASEFQMDSVRGATTAANSLAGAAFETNTRSDELEKVSIQLATQSETINNMVASFTFSGSETSPENYDEDVSLENFEVDPKVVSLRRERSTRATPTSKNSEFSVLDIDDRGISGF